MPNQNLSLHTQRDQITPTQMAGSALESISEDQVSPANGESVYSSPDFPVLEPSEALVQKSTNLSLHTQRDRDTQPTEYTDKQRTLTILQEARGRVMQARPYHESAYWVLTSAIGHVIGVRVSSVDRIPHLSDPTGVQK